MKIDIAIALYDNWDNLKIPEIAAGIIMKATEKKQSITRSSAYYLYQSTNERALILSTIVALESINKEHRNSEVSLFYVDKSIVSLLDADRATENIIEMGLLRQAISDFSDLSVSDAIAIDDLEKCVELAKLALNKRSNMFNVSI